MSINDNLINSTHQIDTDRKKEIEEKAKLANQSVVNYLITLSQNQRIVVAKKMPQLIKEINKIGVNINQVTAVANSTKYVSKEILLKVREELTKMIIRFRAWKTKSTG